MSRTVPLEWFDERGPRAGQRDAVPNDVGLRFSCTQCGSCCTGASGYVSFTDAEAHSMASHLGLSVAEFTERFVHETSEGPSLREKETEFGFDCVFLDRKKVPGKAVCSLYQHRPAQCRTWPFWKSNLSSQHAWRRASIECPGIDRGTRVTPPEIIREQRSVVEM